MATVADAVLALLSVLPSLLPRAWYAQVVLTALCTVVRYVCGLPIDVLARRWPTTARSMRATSRRSARRLRCAGLLVVSSSMTWGNLRWHAEQRALIPGSLP